MRYIGINGQYGSGKDTVAEIITKLSAVKFNIISFADKLKESCAIEMGLPLEMFLTQEGKATLIPALGITCGELLQKKGDGVRETVNKEYWIISRHSTLDTNKNYINSSVRYPNEGDAIRGKGGIVIRVNGDPKGYRSQPNPTRDLNHPSETSMNDYNFDFVIENDGTLEELEEKVKSILMHLNLL
jgi:hypothetical protein